jgi:two-component system phosphate regulon sensor histidine kinase PhoR
MAIENAMLYAALHRHAEELERRVHERTERIKNMYEGQSKFLADLSHEFQTPISILKGNVERLEKTNNTKKKSEFYTMETTLDRLSRLVGNLLSIARLNSPKANLEKKRINVEKLLEQAYDDCLVLANDKGITLSFSSEKCFLFGNIDKLKEVLLNLISNALKHTLPGGAISLSARVIDDEVEIAVADTGSGISRKNLPHVFERLYKIDDNGLGGTGLGLHICRQIIEAHGGTITAESTVGKGSRFIVHLPLPLHDSGKFAIL